MSVGVCRGSVAVFVLGPLTACLLPFMVCSATSVDKYELTTDGDLVCSKASARGRTAPVALWHACRLWLSNVAIHCVVP